MTTQEKDMGNIFVIEARRVADTPGLIIKEGKAIQKREET